jgi:hypothetical protein
VSRWHSQFQFETPQQGLVTKITFGHADRCAASEEARRLGRKAACHCAECEAARDREADETVAHMVRRGVLAS